MSSTKVQYAAFLTVMGLAVAAAVPAAQPRSLAITGATIIDGTGKAPLSDGVVVVVDGRIAAVGRARDVSIPRGAQKLDGRGKYVIPGLMDGVNMTWFSTNVENLVRYEGRYHEILIECAQVALKNGITGAFATWRTHNPAMKARDMIESGAAVGASIYVGGNIIGFDGMFSADSSAAAAPFVSPDFVKRTNDEFVQGTGRDLMWMGPEEVRAVIRNYVQTHKLDYLKYAANAHWLQGGVLNAEYLSFSERVQKVIVEEGHRASLSVQAHAMSGEGIDMAVEAGVDLLTHGDMSGPKTPIPAETLQKMVERHVFAGVLPITQRNLELRQREEPGDFTQFLEVAKVNRRNMIKAGVPLLLGTEAGLKSPTQPPTVDDKVDPSLHSYVGVAHFNAMVALEEEGMSRMEILKSATSNIAKAFKLDADVGTVESGKVANLVILGANPLDDVRNYRRIDAVIKDGKVVDRNALPLAPIISVKTAGGN